MTHKDILKIWDPISTAKQAVETSKTALRKNASSHNKLVYKKRKMELADALEPLTQLFQSFLPKGWDMESWTFTPSSDPDEIRWGKRNTGATITLSKNNLCHVYGLLSELAIQSQSLRFKKDDAKLSKMGLDINAMQTFMFQDLASNLGRGSATGTYIGNGKSPVDAYARLLVEGQLFKGFFDCFATTPRDAFDEGQRTARHTLRQQGRHWSASMALWDAIAKNPCYKALRKGNQVMRLSRTDLRLGRSTFYLEKEFTWLKNALETCGETQKLSPQFVSTGLSPKGYLVNAWDANSAVVVAQFCHLILEPGNHKSISKNIHFWKVHPAPAALEHSLTNY